MWSRFGDSGTENKSKYPLLAESLRSSGIPSPDNWALLRRKVSDIKRGGERPTVPNDDIRGGFFNGSRLSDRPRVSVDSLRRVPTRAIDRICFVDEPPRNVVRLALERGVSLVASVVPMWLS